MSVAEVYVDYVLKGRLDRAILDKERNQRTILCEYILILHAEALCHCPYLIISKIALAPYSQHLSALFQPLIEPH